MKESAIYSLCWETFFSFISTLYHDIQLAVHAVFSRCDKSPGGRPPSMSGRVRSSFVL